MHLPAQQAQPVFPKPTRGLLAQKKQVLGNPQCLAGDSGAGPTLQQMIPAAPPAFLTQSKTPFRLHAGHPGHAGQIVHDAGTHGQLVIEGIKLMDSTYCRPPMHLFDSHQSTAQLYQFAPLQDGQDVHRAGAPVLQLVQAPLEYSTSLVANMGYNQS